MYLLDSVILIDHLNGKQEAEDILVNYRTEIFISPITRAEVLAGVRTAFLTSVKKLLDQFHFTSIEKQDADLAADLRQSKKLKLPDAFQAAMAINRDFKLVTRNTKDFPEKKYPFVWIPYL